MIGLLGTWFGSSVSENEAHDHGEILTRVFTSAEGAGAQKAAPRRKDSPSLSLMQVMDLSPSHGSGQGAHSSRWANLKQIVTGRRGKEEGAVTERHFSQMEAKWSHQDFL